MPDLLKVKLRLETELKEHIARAEKIENRLRQPGEVDWEEQATQRENDEVLESLGNQTVKEIDQIKQALQRIDKGIYGICARCGAKIAPQRLELLPYATTCAGCQ